MAASKADDDSIASDMVDELEDVDEEGLFKDDNDTTGGIEIVLTPKSTNQQDALVEHAIDSMRLFADTDSPIVLASRDDNPSTQLKQKGESIDKVGRSALRFSWKDLPENIRRFFRTFGNCRQMFVIYCAETNKIFGVATSKSGFKGGKAYIKAACKGDFSRYDEESLFGMLGTEPRLIQYTPCPKDGWNLHDILIIKQIKREDEGDDEVAASGMNAISDEKLEEMKEEAAKAENQAAFEIAKKALKAAQSIKGTLHTNDTRYFFIFFMVDGNGIKIGDAFAKTSNVTLSKELVGQVDKATKKKFEKKFFTPGVGKGRLWTCVTRHYNQPAKLFHGKRYWVEMVTAEESEEYYGTVPHNPTSKDFHENEVNPPGETEDRELTDDGKFAYILEMYNAL